MQEIVAQIVTQIRSAWRFRWYAIAAAWVVAIGGWVYVLTLPDIYEARARVYVDTDSVLRPLLSGLAVDSNVQNRVAMMSRVLMSRPNLEKVARETDLYLRTPTPEAFVRLIDSLPQEIKLEGGGRDSTYTLRYSDTDPEMARRVVQTLLDTFVEDTLGVKRADSNTAQEFLQQQIREYEARLRDAEERLAAFKKENVGLMPGTTGDFYTRLQTSLGHVQELRAKYRLVDQRRSELQKQIEGESPTFGIFTEQADDGSAVSSDARIVAYKRQLDQLLLQYTEKHPKVLALKETIAQVEAQLQAQNTRKSSIKVPRNSGEAAAHALDINPVYQSLRIDLSKAQVELAELREQIAAEEATIANLRSRVDTIPEIEAQLTRLNRDYEVNRLQHQQLLQRLESARLSEQAETSTEGVKFRMIEPVVKPLLPTGPNRGLFMSGALIFALGVAGALAFGLSQLRPVFFSRAMLKTVTGLPVLGTISYMEPVVRKPFLRRDSVLIGTAFGSLIFAYMVGVTLADDAIRVIRSVLG